MSDVISPSPSTTEWVGGLVTLPVIFTQGMLHCPTAILWAEVRTGLVVGIDICPSHHARTRAPVVLLEAIREPKAGPPRVPARVRVATHELANTLRGSIGEIEIVVGDTPELAPIIVTLLSTDTNPTWLTDGISSELVRHFFEATAALHRVAPWKRVPPPEVFSVRCAALGIEAGVMFVRGPEETERGVALFRTEAEAATYINDEADAEGIFHGPMPEHISVGYQDRCAPSIAREIHKHGWQTHGAVYPTAVFVTSDHTYRLLTRDELAGIAAVVGSLAALVAGEPWFPDAWTSGPTAISRTMNVTGPTGAIEVTLSAPLPRPIFDCHGARPAKKPATKVARKRRVATARKRTKR